MSGILTEEELKFYEENALGTNYWNMTDALQSVITSHRNLLSANAELSFKNNKLEKENTQLTEYKTAYQKAIGDYKEELK